MIKTGMGYSWSLKPLKVFHTHLASARVPKDSNNQPSQLWYENENHQSRIGHRKKFRRTQRSTVEWTLTTTRRRTSQDRTRSTQAGQTLWHLIGPVSPTLSLLKTNRFALYVEDESIDLFGRSMDGSLYRCHVGTLCSLHVNPVIVDGGRSARCVESSRVRFIEQGSPYTCVYTGCPGSRVRLAHVVCCYYNTTLARKKTLKFFLCKKLINFYFETASDSHMLNI